MATTWIPIFLFIYFIPSNADTPLYNYIEKIIDQDFFGKVGMWSSAFPLTSKLITNYICLAAPPFAVIFTYRTIKKSIFERTNYPDHSGIKIIILILAFVTFSAFLLYTLYLDSTNLALASRRLAVFGTYKFTYALYSAGTLYLIYIVTTMNYLIFRFFPAYIIQKIRSTR